MILVFFKVLNLNIQIICYLDKCFKTWRQALVHHFETVEGATPNCSANHLLLLFFSAKTTFSLSMSLSMSENSIIWGKDTNFLFKHANHSKI